MRAHDADRRVLVIPNHKPGVRETLRLSKADVDRAVWVITSEGERLEGAAAINRMLQELPRWRWFARLYAVPLFRVLEDVMYRWVAAHRRWLSFWGVTPECARPGVECVPEGA